MKNLYILILILSGSISYAQTKIEKRYELSDNQTVQLEFDDASVISVIGWQENYILVTASISINNNTQNNAYTLEETTSNGNKKITGFVKNIEQLPKVIRIKKGDEIFTFSTDDWDSPEILKFYEEHGEDGINWKSHGLSWDIDLTINVPQNRDVIIVSKHGIVELDNLHGNVAANSTHGGIDLSVGPNMKGNLTVKTRWGNIYSNLKLDIDEGSSSNKDWNLIVASINGGNNKSIKLESKHANIYLRTK